MPCTERFDAQDAAYRDSVLPPAVRARVAVEAGSTGLWWRYVGDRGRVVGIDHYGASGKAPELFKKFGITAEHVQQEILESIKGTDQMTLKVGINGYGRIGRNVLRALHEGDKRGENSDRGHQRSWRRQDQRSPDTP